MHAELRAHPDYFTKEVVKLADNVYMAFGFAASNVYMLIGDDGVVIIDTSETTAAAGASLLTVTPASEPAVSAPTV